MPQIAAIYSEEGAALYRFVYDAARGLLETARRTRNEVEILGPSRMDLSQAEKDLEAAVKALNIWLYPAVIDGNPIDPRDNPDWRGLPNAEEVDIAEELRQSRGGVFSAFGFSARSAHGVVLQLGEQTRSAFHVLQQARKAVALQGRQAKGRGPGGKGGRRSPRTTTSGEATVLDQLFAEDSWLRTEDCGLGRIEASEVRRVAAECLQEAEEAWRRAKAAQAGSDQPGPLSEPDTPNRWATTFGVSVDTFKRWCKQGKIRHKKLTDRRYQVHLDDIPKRLPGQQK